MSDGGDRQQAVRGRRGKPSLIKELVRQRHLSFTAFCGEYGKAASTVAPRDLPPSRATWNRWLAGTIKYLPHPDTCLVLEAMFSPWTAEELFKPPLSPPLNGNGHAEGLLDAVPASFGAEAVCGHWVTSYAFDHGGVAQHHADIACITGTGRWVKATNHPPAPRSGDRAMPFCNEIEAQIVNRHLIGVWKNTSDTRYFGTVQLAVHSGENVMERNYTGFASDVTVSTNRWKWVRLEPESVERADLATVVLREPSALYALVMGHSQTAALLTLAEIREED